MFAARIAKPKPATSALSNAVARQPHSRANSAPLGPARKRSGELSGGALEPAWPRWNFATIPLFPPNRPSAAPPEAVPVALGSPGRPLDSATRASFETSFGHDFSRVRVHTSEAAAQSALDEDADAYTVGQHIVFGAGRFVPETLEGLRLLSHELTHVVQQAAGGSAPPGAAEEQDAHSAARAVEAGQRPHVRAKSAIGLAAQPRGLKGEQGVLTERNAGVRVVTYEEIWARVKRIMDHAGFSAADGRADFNRNPAVAKANLYHQHFQSDDDRLSYAYGVFQAYLGAGGGGVDRDELFGELVQYETEVQRKTADLIVHATPTQAESRQLEELRRKSQAEKARQGEIRARQWEIGSREHRKLADVTRFATPAHTQPDPLIGDPYEPRRPMRGAIAGYRLKGQALHPLDLLPKEDFKAYASDWERDHSGILFPDHINPVGDRGVLAPVVSATSSPPGMPDLPTVEYSLISYFGMVQCDHLFVPEAVEGSDPATLMALLALDIPVFAYSPYGRPLSPHYNYGDHKYLVRTDANGKVLDLWGVFGRQEPGLISVISPIDFIGPGLLARPLIGATGALVRGAARVLPEIPGVLAKGAAAALPEVRAAVSSVLRKGSLSLELAMRGARLPALTLTETPAAFVLREAGQAGATTEAAVVAEDVSAGAAPGLRVDPRTTSDVFAEIQTELGLETPGTVTYSSTAAAAAGAVAASLRTPTRPGYQTHSTAPSVRRALGLSGYQWQSVHMVFQAAYRALRARGYVRPDSRPYSPGRALTTVDLPLAAHRAFDAGWIPQWKAATAAGQTIPAGTAYRWLSSAINAVDPALISPALQGVILDRIRTELFVELGLGWNDIIVP
jgi:hypothetical protein